MTDAVISYTDEDTGTVFRWHGGAYIDVGYVSDYPYATPGAASREPLGGGATFHAHDVINVYDDDEDITTLEKQAREAGHKRPFRHILELFEARCQQYLAEAYDDDDAPEGDDAR